jgi:hypothetical protein
MALYVGVILKETKSRPDSVIAKIYSKTEKLGVALN